MKVTDFAIENVNGQRCVKKITTELSKNHQGTSNENEGTGALMFSTGTTRCPVISFEKYLSKRTKMSPRLFLHPKQRFMDEDEVWYRNEPIGVNALKKFMKKLSKSASLSREYTNHCIRSTTITLLNHCGFESRHIATIIGHRNQASLSSYCYDTSDKQKKAMSDALSLCIQSKPTTNTDPRNGITSTATITRKEEVTNGTGILVPIPTNALDIELNDEDLVHYATEMELSCTSISCTSADVRPQNQPMFNFSGCTVKINNYMR